MTNEATQIASTKSAARKERTSVDHDIDTKVELASYLSAWSDLLSDGGTITNANVYAFDCNGVAQ